MLIDTSDRESGDLRNILVRIISSCTWLNCDMTYAANLFELGLDSLQAISLSKQINAYVMQAMPNLKPIKRQTIYAHPSIKELELTLQSVLDSSMRGFQHREMQIVFDEWSSYETMEPVDVDPENSIVILLIGSTGSLGSYILDTLLSLPSVEKIYCLNRGEDREIRQQKSFVSKGPKV